MIPIRNSEIAGQVDMCTGRRGPRLRPAIWQMGHNWMSHVTGGVGGGGGVVTPLSEEGVTFCFRRAGGLGDLLSLKEQHPHSIWV